MDIELLRELCLRLAAVTEAIKWEEHLVFSVGGKMFCIAGTNDPFDFSVKVPAEVFEELCAQPGVVPAPYLARARWVQFTKPAQLFKKEAEQLVAGSYALVVAKLTRRQKTELGLV